MARKNWMVRGGVGAAVVATVVFTMGPASAAEHTYMVINGSPSQTLVIHPAGYNGDHETDSFAEVSIPPGEDYVWEGTAESYFITFTFPTGWTYGWRDNTHDRCMQVNDDDGDMPYIVDQDFASVCALR